MHVYHYGGYEAGAIKRLMQRHGTRVDEVDRLLRGRCPRRPAGTSSGRASAPRSSRYSLKQIEKFYMPAREGPVTEAGFSVVAFETWLKEARPGHPLWDRRVQPRRLRLDVDAACRGLKAIDVRGGRAMAGLAMGPARRRRLLEAPRGINGPAPKRRRTGHRTDLRPGGLMNSVRGPRRGRLLLADLLDWHRREEKSQWWRWYELRRQAHRRGARSRARCHRRTGGSWPTSRTEGRAPLVRRYRFRTAGPRIPTWATKSIRSPSG